MKASPLQISNITNHNHHLYKHISGHFATKLFTDILCVRDGLPVNDSPLDEDSDLDLYRGGGVGGDTQGDGGIVVHNIQRTQVN